MHTHICAEHQVLPVRVVGHFVVSADVKAVSEVKTQSSVSKHQSVEQPHMLHLWCLYFRWTRD